MSHRAPLRFVLAALGGGCVTTCAGPWGGVALAESAVVALVRPDASTPSASEALNRIEGELTAEGFDVVVVDAPIVLQPSGAQPTPRVGTLPGREPIASIELAVDARERTAELRVMDRLTNKAVVRRAPIEAPEGPQFAQVLAVRAVELLRASLVEVLVLSHPPPSAMPPATAKVAVEQARRWTAASLDAGRPATLGFDAGTAVLAGFGGIDPALLGVLRVRRALGRSFQLRATLAGLGTQPIVHASSGSASVSQDLGMLELLVTPWADRPVRPVASIGAGPYFVAIEGNATAGYSAARSSGWSAALDAGVGAEIGLGRHFDVSAEIHALLTEPRQVTRFIGQEQASMSEPAILGTLTVVGWL